MNNISIIIVNFKSWKPLEYCLNSLLNQNNVNTDIIVVDNYSNDNKIDLFVMDDLFFLDCEIKTISNPKIITNPKIDKV